MSGFEFSPSSAYAAACVAAVATYFWRAFGVAIGARLDLKGRVFEWFASVAYAVLAALVVRLIVFPAGELAHMPLAARLGAAGIALGAYAVGRKSIFAGCFAGASTIAVAAIWLAQ
ncbi:MAG: AzlD domain-containing protein [Alphaproteobacteria bacterium]|nr:AzlD domain-containing protein [Alphaproteobacteria bacterium]